MQIKKAPKKVERNFNAFNDLTNELERFYVHDENQLIFAIKHSVETIFKLRKKIEFELKKLNETLKIQDEALGERSIKCNSEGLESLDEILGIHGRLMKDLERLTSKKD
jgi:hypothetical protein